MGAAERLGMARMERGRRMVCTRCSTDHEGPRKLGIHLISQHSASPIPHDTEPTGGRPVTANHQLLTRDEESALGHLIQAGGERAREARNFLVESNLRLVISVVMKRRFKNSPVTDLIQDGNIGLMRAAELFDPSKGFRFSTYAVWWILQTIQRAEGGLEMVSVPEGSKQKIKKARKLLAAGQPIEDVARELNYSPGKLTRILDQASARTYSMDQKISGHEDNTFEAVIAADPAQEPILAKDELSSVLAGLSERERLVLVRRFGLDGKPEQTLAEISRTLRVSRERIRQIEVQALSVLKRRHERKGTLLNHGAFVTRRQGNFMAITSEHKAIAAAVDRGDEEIREEAIMATLDPCVKGCGKTFTYAPAKGKHEKSCDGTPKPEQPLRAPRKAKRTRPRRLTSSRSGGKAPGGILSSVVAMLQDKRSERVAVLTANDKQLAEIDRVIAALEGNPI